MRNEPCFCGSGIKTKKCHKDIESNSAFAQLIQLHQEIDKEIRTNKGAVLCKNGCASCCYEPFSISSSEFFFIMNHIIEKYGEEKAREINKKGFDIWKEVEENHPKLASQLKENIDGIEGSDTLFKLVYDSVDGSAGLKYPCPFLDEKSQSCTVYEVRPLVCRSYGVGYFEKMNQPFSLCGHIQNGLEYQKNMADLTEYKDIVENWTRIPTKDYGVVYDRPYPVFYFMKIQEQNWAVTIRKIKDLKQFSLETNTVNKVTRAKNRSKLR